MIAELAVTSGLGSSFNLMGIGWDWFCESVRLCVNLCPLFDNNLCLLLDIILCLLLDNNICLLLDNNLCLLLDNNICLLLDNNLCLLLDNNIGLRWDYVFCWTTILVFGGTMSSVGHYPYGHILFNSDIG
jgi:hypothetical protein